VIRVEMSVSTLEKLRDALKTTPDREIGGVLLGQHLGDDVFLIVDLSLQITGGSKQHFVRDPALHKPFIDDFFERTGHDYATFNYLGEWHSHIDVAPIPRSEDIRTMQAHVANPEVNAPFALLVIVRQGKDRNVELSATVFQEERSPAPVSFSISPDQHHAHHAS
jgi:integrative and conjugative element protein (TIGR02256 family)